jgi:hypothetical protein
MSLVGQSLPMRYAPVSHHVGNGLKADVPGKGRNGKTATLSRVATVCAVSASGKVKNLHALTRHTQCHL